VEILQESGATSTITVDLSSLPPDQLSRGVTGVRYARWTRVGEPLCCGTQSFTYTPCPPNSCPISASVSDLPAMPFEAELTAAGKCKCLAPQVCDGGVLDELSTTALKSDDDDDESSRRSLGTATLYGAGGKTADLAVVAAKLLAKLDASKGLFHANATLWTTKQSSFHLFATNRTEECHYHPGTTLAEVLSGTGAFRVPYGAPVVQRARNSFFIPEGEAHAFGPATEGSGPVLVFVLWTPPFHSNYTIKMSGCRMEA